MCKNKTGENPTSPRAEITFFSSTFRGSDSESIKCRVGAFAQFLKKEAQFVKDTGMSRSRLGTADWCTGRFEFVRKKYLKKKS